MSPLPGLLIGRFQPFHKGHMDAVKQALVREKKIIIAIGSSEDFGTDENPFTASDRYQMIDASLKEAKIPATRYIIIPVRDIHNDAQWVAHVERTLPLFGSVYTGSPVVKKLFQRNRNHEVVTLKKRLKINGTLVRANIAKRNISGWKKMVPKAVAEYITATRTA